MTKTASLITVHTGPNFGTVLQVIATKEVLTQHGVSSILVNYIPPRDTYHRFIKNYAKKVKNAKSFKSMLAILLYFCKECLLFKRNNRIYLGCLTKYVKLSQPIYVKDCFEKKCPQSDIYITGSDQVWNTFFNEGIDGHYFFEGIDGKKISISSSFGMDKLSHNEAIAYQKLLSTYSYLSVRESQAVKLLSDIGFSSIQVLDPTMMLDRIGWANAVKITKKISSPYLLVYIPYNVHDYDDIYRVARNIAEKHSLKVLTFSWGFDNEPRADITLKFQDPVDFLSLMYHADYVVTNSFHGTAFSINLNRNFSVFMPTQFSSRIESVLKLCNLEDRLVMYYQNINNMVDTIDYKIVNEILNRERQKFHDYLTVAL